MNLFAQWIQDQIARFKNAANTNVIYYGGKLLALVDVKTALYDPAWDLAQGCRTPPAAP